MFIERPQWVGCGGVGGKVKQTMPLVRFFAGALVENFGGTSKRDGIYLWPGEYPLSTALRRKQAMARATSWVKAARSVSGIVIGYLIFVLGAWVVQEEILGGVSYHDDLTTIVLAGFLTPVAAAIGAIVTVIVAGRHPWLHLIPMFTLIVVETAYLYAKGRVDGPLWFETAAGASLIVGGMAGVLFWPLLSKWRWADHASSA